MQLPHDKFFRAAAGLCDADSRQALGQLDVAAVCGRHGIRLDSQRKTRLERLKQVRDWLKDLGPLEALLGAAGLEAATPGDGLDNMRKLLQQELPASLATVAVASSSTATRRSTWRSPWCGMAARRAATDALRPRRVRAHRGERPAAARPQPAHRRAQVDRLRSIVTVGVAGDEVPSRTAPTSSRRGCAVRRRCRAPRGGGGDGGRGREAT